MQSEFAPPDVCFSSIDVAADDKWNINDNNFGAIAAELTAGNEVKSQSPNDFFGDQCQGAVGCLPDLCSTVDLSQCSDEVSIQVECTNCIDVSEKLSLLENDDISIPLELQKCIRDTCIQLSSKKVNCISCDAGIASGNYEISANCIVKDECDKNCAFSATTDWDIGLVRQNIVQSSDPKYYFWENVVSVPNQLLGTILIHSHGTSLGYLTSSQYGFTSPRHSSLYDTEPEISEEDKIKLAKRYGLIHHLPCGSFDGSTNTRECVICMIEFTEGDQLRYLPCVHTYHMACIDAWLMRSFTCPSCLEPVDAALLSTYETS